MSDELKVGHIEFNPLHPSYSWGSSKADHVIIKQPNVTRFDHPMRSIIICIDKREMRVRFSDETEDSITIHIEKIE